MCKEQNGNFFVLLFLLAGFQLAFVFFKLCVLDTAQQQNDVQSSIIHPYVTNTKLTMITFLCLMTNEQGRKF